MTLFQDDRIAWNEKTAKAQVDSLEKSADAAEKRAKQASFWQRKQLQQEAISARGKATAAAEVNAMMKQLIEAEEVISINPVDATRAGPGDYDQQKHAIQIERRQNWVYGEWAVWSKEQCRPATYSMIIAHELLGRAYGDVVHRQDAQSMGYSTRQRTMNNPAVERANKASRVAGDAQRGDYTQDGGQYLGDSVYLKYYGVPYVNLTDILHQRTPARDP